MIQFLPALKRRGLLGVGVDYGKLRYYDSAMTIPRFFLIAGSMYLAATLVFVTAGILAHSWLTINLAVGFGIFIAVLTLVFSGISVKRGFPRFDSNN